MTQTQVLALFRQKAVMIKDELPMMNMVIMELAQLLADSRGRLSKENFDRLVHIGGALYKEGNAQFKAKSDLHPVMAKPATDPSNS